MAQLAATPDTKHTLLLPPVERPKNPLWRFAFSMMRRQMGKVMTPASVWSVRMPFKFTRYYMKIGGLNKKLELSKDMMMFVRQRVAETNGCGFCADMMRANALRESVDNKAKFDALAGYSTSPLFTEAERAALDYATELTETKAVGDETGERLRQHFSDREVCDLAFVIASEHLLNITNIGLGIGSDGICAIYHKD